MRPRCYIPPEEWTADALRPSPDRTHHLRDVLRLRAGDSVIAFNGRGRWAGCTVVLESRGALSLRIQDIHESPPPALRITLLPSLIRAQRMDWLIQKAVELGVTRLVPLIAERGLIRTKNTPPKTRRDRWLKIAVQAAAQCGNLWLPQIDLPLPLGRALLLRKELGLCLIGSTTSNARPLREALENARRRKTDAVAFMSGPEGGFTPAEESEAVAAGWLPVSLGDLTLRAETAPLFAAAAARYALAAPG